MSAYLLDGKAVAARIERELAERIAELGRQGVRPTLVVIRVGVDPASEIYVRNKARKAEELGLRGIERHFPETLSEPDLLTEIARLNADTTVDGILVQLPLPPHIDSTKVIEAIDPAKDVDGFHPVNVGRLQLGQRSLVPCTPAGVIELIDASGVPIAGKRAVIVGRSNIVGKPVAALLLARHATVTVCHSRTPDLAAVTREGEILVAAIGKPMMISGPMVREGAVVVDVGINRVTPGTEAEALLAGDPQKREALERRGSVIVGDVDFAAARERAAWITPVPGGVGPMTIIMLMRNTVTAAIERRR